MNNKSINYAFALRNGLTILSSASLPRSPKGHFVFFLVVFLYHNILSKSRARANVKCVQFLWMDTVLLIKVFDSTLFKLTDY